MKTSLHSRFEILPRARNESGLAVILVMALLAIVLIYIAGNLGTLHHLGRELRLLEQKQVRRLDSVSKTNHVASSETNPVALPKTE
jgi:hypothetical protein